MVSRQPILMPQLGLTMTEGTLAEWKVAPGDRVKAGDVIFLVETDKISNDIEAAADGVIEALHAVPGDVLPVGGVLATIVTDGDDANGDPPRLEVASNASDFAKPPQRARTIATPLARRLATEAGIEIGSAVGSGPGGRIVADDVTAVIESRNRGSPTARSSPDAATRSTSRGEIRPLGQYQKIAARRVTESKRDIPHFYIFTECDVTALLGMRLELNAAPGFTKITVSHFIVAAVARALANTPELNRVWTDEGLLELAQVDVGLAVESPRGLVVPILRDLATCCIDDVAQAATRFTQAARTGQLRAEDLQGGAIAISNVGMFGATGLLPIINPGQSSILGVGRNRPVFLPDEHDQPRLRQVLNLTLSCDHRAIDGALAARFLQKIQHGLETPLAFSRRPRGGPGK
jgi:pyruvate dehydrogenase E2 component (dihydrolipoyllysine-residue acetyltransferase)